MTQTTHPDKRLVRKVMAQRRADRQAPMTPAQFREALGWRMLADERRR